MRTIAIIGAGWAGLTAALTLQRQGHAVTLYERSPAHQGAGGRASTAYGAGLRAPFAIDNGQHVLLGAYRDSLALMVSLNINVDQAFLRLPAAWYVPQHLNIAIPSWADSPAPNSAWKTGVLKQLPMALALLKASALGQWPGLLAASVRMQRSAPYSAETVCQWLERLRFPGVLKEHLWLPLCYATLNTAPRTASAVVFSRVIQDGLLAGSQAAAMLVPRVDLAALLSRPALAELQSLGTVLKLGVAVERVYSAPGGIAVQTLGAEQSNAQNKVQTYDGLICATTAKDAARTLPSDCISQNLATLAEQSPEPISTIHLNIGQALRLPKAVCVLPEPKDNDHPICHAVAIDRAYLSPNQQGWITLVLSCSGAALAYSHETLIQAALNRLKACFPGTAWPGQCSGVVIHAKQATFACTASLQRPTAHTQDARIVLAGDYVAGQYPATLEGAVRSGLKAAALISAKLG